MKTKINIVRTVVLLLISPLLVVGFVADLLCGGVYAGWREGEHFRSYL
jgi:hypothetical protein